MPVSILNEENFQKKYKCENLSGATKLRVRLTNNPLAKQYQVKGFDPDNL